MPLMQGWTADERRAYGREVVRFRHRLADSGLFTDEALAVLLDEHPREALDVLTMRRDPPPDQPWIAGSAGTLSGAEVLEAVRRGAVWVNARLAMSRHPRYRALFRRLVGEFSGAIGRPVIRPGASILVSGPRMGIFLHVDASETTLWQVRGTKAVHLYPAGDDGLPEPVLEELLLKEAFSVAPHRPEMEAAARAFTVAPGEGLAWPLHSPHRVVNGADLSVSVACEYSTVRSLLTNGVFYVNGRLRRTTGVGLRSRGVPLGLAPLHWAAAKVLRLAAPQRRAEPAQPIQFDLDLAAPDCIRWREGFGPQARAAA